MKVLRFLLFILFAGVLTAHAQDDFKGTASFYADKFVGQKTANGDIYNHYKYTCAHKTLPFGTKLRVTNLDNNKSVIVIVNDRGPFVKSRVLDLSKSAAQQINMLHKGLANVYVEILDGNSLPIDEESLELSEVYTF